MGTISAKSFMSIYVVWHAGYADGNKIANGLFEHYRRKVFDNVSGGLGIQVLFRSGSDGDLPLPIDLSESNVVAVVILLEANLIEDEQWVRYADGIVRDANKHGLCMRAFPVAIEKSAYRVGEELSTINCVRWEEWSDEAHDEKMRRLQVRLSYEFCRMLRLNIVKMQTPDGDIDELVSSLKKEQIFLSHSKHDPQGEHIARLIQANLAQDVDLSGFFDAINIPPGVSFQEVIEHSVKVSAMVVVHTDSYSSREWCRREIVGAKMACVPMVVVNCLDDFEERCFPYLGNSPVIRFAGGEVGRVAKIVGQLVDEVLKTFLWSCQVEFAKALTDSNATFLSRPPELILLAKILGVNDSAAVRQVVYPDPPLGKEEIGLFNVISPGLALLSYTQWLAVWNEGAAIA